MTLVRGDPRWLVFEVIQIKGLGLLVGVRQHLCDAVRNRRRFVRFFSCVAQDRSLIFVHRLRVAVRRCLLHPPPKGGFSPNLRVRAFFVRAGRIVSGPRRQPRHPLGGVCWVRCQVSGLNGIRFRNKRPIRPEFTLVSTNDGDTFLPAPYCVANR